MMIIDDVCNNCSEILFNAPVNGSAALELMVEDNITDFGFPLYGSKEQEKFRGFPFIPIGRYVNDGSKGNRGIPFY